jgi:hypothetical protein
LIVSCICCCVAKSNYFASFRVYSQNRPQESSALWIFLNIRNSIFDQTLACCKNRGMLFRAGILHGDNILSSDQFFRPFSVVSSLAGQLRYEGRGMCRIHDDMGGFRLSLPAFVWQQHAARLQLSASARRTPQSS